LRDEVPIDDIAEYLVDAHAVLINGEPLRRTDDRRGDVAAKIEVALELVAGLVAERHAGQRARHGAEKVGAGRLTEIGAGQHLDVGRNLVLIDGAGLGRRRNGRRGSGCPACGDATARRTRTRAMMRRRHRRGGDDVDFGKSDAWRENLGALRGNPLRRARRSRRDDAQREPDGCTPNRHAETPDAKSGVWHPSMSTPRPTTGRSYRAIG
jgi:hypothetical protein